MSKYSNPFQLLFLDGVYVQDGAGRFAFHYNKAPTVEQLTAVLHTISQRVASFLERRGLLERDEDNSYLTLDGLDEDPMCACLPWRDFCFLYLHQPGHPWPGVRHYPSRARVGL